MTLSPAARSPLANLLQLMAVWLVVLLLVQGLQGAIALGAGPRHTHGGAASQLHTHEHDGVQRHHHARGDPTVRWEQGDPALDAALDAAAQALTLAMALMAFAVRRQGLARAGHLLRAALPWFWRSVVAPLLRRPPRTS